MIDALIYIAIGIVVCAFASAGFSARVRNTVTRWYTSARDSIGGNKAP